MTCIHVLYFAGHQQQQQQQLLQQQAMLMQRMLSSGMAGPSGQDHQALANNNSLQAGMYAGQLHGRPLGTMSHGQALVPSHGQGLVPSGSQAYLGMPSEVEAVLKDAHEAYRSGEYTRALQFCHAVRAPPHFETYGRWVLVVILVARVLTSAESSSGGLGRTVRGLH